MYILYEIYSIYESVTHPPSPGGHMRLGPITIAVLLEDILFISDFSVTLDKNLIKYLHTENNNMFVMLHHKAFILVTRLPFCERCRPHTHMYRKIEHSP